MPGSDGESDAPDIAYGTGGGDRRRPGRHGGRAVGGRWVAGRPDREESPGRQRAAAQQGDRPATVTLVIGDRVLVSRDRAGTPSATVLPRADGSTPLVQTRRSGPGPVRLPGARRRRTRRSHAGYAPGALTAATLSYSYDGGRTWTEAATSQQGGAWTATVNHAGAAGEPVTLKAELTDSNGNSVTQLVADAYAVR
ncbi:hypothetical protein OG735_32955 [Streptomyces sp. NBC_01210]|uniref:hypothetical protein n=1 Tax=Streptomyces sp. NBC_01210 TaxID=2903774 RepID=UPI002E15FC62|nr:hypothetical protein OG735_32955 [Streptomyces sp. NBC_01210]